MKPKNRIELVVLSILGATVCMTPAATHYVDLASPSPTPPYTNWVTAATNIQDAVDEAVSGETVLVTDGHYYLTSEIVVTNDIIIQSVNGPESTLVNGQANVRCFNLGNNACVINGLTVTNGNTSGAGGGIYVFETTAIITNCTISGNSAQAGGGLYMYNGGTAINCTIRGNSATISGGGMFFGTASNCTISGNSAATQGGGMMDSWAFGCIISSNSAYRGGGLSLCWAQNCTISGNSAANGGGGVEQSGMYNCTITDNHAHHGGGMVVDSAGSAYNCIVWHNDALYGSDIYYSGSFPSTIRYTCSSDVPHGVNGNITNKPLLVSTSHVAINSPCRGAGNSYFARGTDIDGEVWLDPPSMGCDEYHGTVTGALQVAINCITNFTTGYQIAIQGVIDGALSMHIWNFDDGTLVTNNIYPVHAWSNPGTYALVLTAYNDTYPSGVSSTQMISVVSRDATAIHVTLDGNDANDGSNWALAKATIQAGVDAQAYEGGLVWVSNGTYSVTSEIMVAKNITIQSVNGPESTLVDGQGSVRCFNLGNATCILSGLTITNGYTSGSYPSGYGGGILCAPWSPPVVTNCIVIGNSASEAGGGMCGGTANNCMISGNRAFYGGGMYHGTANHCTITGNSADYNGGGMRGGTANNCTTSGNSAFHLGGGMYDVLANNCTIISNSAGSYGGGFAGGNREILANNCTISGNTAGTFGGGMYSGTARNCVVWYNQAPSRQDLGAGAAYYSCAPNLTHGVDGNITNSPLFVDRTNGNYRLLTGSPCINAGDNAAATYGADLDGYPRIIDGTVDMGAYEYGFQGCFITNFVVTNSQAILEWTAFPMWESEVWWTTNLMDGFQPFGTGVDYPINSFTDTVHAAENQCFYGVEVQMK